MIEKVRDIIEQLVQLEDNVKVDDIQSRLKSIKEDAVRQLKDRNELFVDGKNVIRFGKHQFTVNVQELDLTSLDARTLSKESVMRSLIVRAASSSAFSGKSVSLDWSDEATWLSSF